MHRSNTPTTRPSSIHESHNLLVFTIHSWSELSRCPPRIMPCGISESLFIGSSGRESQPPQHFSFQVPLFLGITKVDCSNFTTPSQFHSSNKIYPEASPVGCSGIHF